MIMRAVALAATLVSALLAITMFLQFKAGAVGYQFEQQISWVHSLGISYHVGVDGINVGLMLMAAIVMQTVGYIWIRQVIKIEV